MSALLLLLLLGLLLCVLRRRTRRPGEPPLIRGWIPYLGKALEFGRDAHKFLEEQRRRSGDVFTVLIAGRYMTFIMDPLLYPSVIKHGRQLDFHQFADSVAPPAFGYPPVRAFPGLWGQVRRSFQLLQGDALPALTQSMLGNLQLVLRQDHSGRGWSRGLLSRFCSAVMFEATLMTVYGRAAGGGRHAGAAALLRNFCRFDAAFPLLLARVPVRLLGRTRSTRELLIQHFLPQNLDRWTDTSLFIRRRAELFEQYPGLRDRDKTLGFGT
ncbi:LOW QUALITY PROTEIN: cytochrome P450 7B1-like [Menidia menidia]